MWRLFVSYSEDPARTLAAALQPFGSLRCTRQQAGALLDAIGVPVPLDVKPEKSIHVSEAVDDIIVKAVPEEGYPHPQRAIDWAIDDDHVTLSTPGGVLVTIDRDGIHFEFNRNSRF